MYYPGGSDSFGIYLNATNLNAEIQLSQIPENFRLSDDQSKEYSDYTYFYFFRKSLLESNSSLQNLDSAQLASLISFSQG